MRDRLLVEYAVCSRPNKFLMTPDGQRPEQYFVKIQENGGTTIHTDRAHAPPHYLPRLGKGVKSYLEGVGYYTAWGNRTPWPGVLIVERDIHLFHFPELPASLVPTVAQEALQGASIFVRRQPEETDQPNLTTGCLALMGIRPNAETVGDCYRFVMWVRHPRAKPVPASLVIPAIRRDYLKELALYREVARCDQEARTPEAVRAAFLEAETPQVTPYSVVDFDFSLVFMALRAYGDKIPYPGDEQRRSFAEVEGYDPHAVWKNFSPLNPA